MAGSLSVSLLPDLASRIGRVVGALSRADVRRVMGRAIVQVLKDHFFGLAGERHRPGVPVNFYSTAARGVQQPDISDDGLSITINNVGIAQRYFGGTIEGKPWLTIPAVPQAFGRRAREFDNLKMIFFGKRRDLAALVSRDEGGVSLTRGNRSTKQRMLTVVPREDGRPQVIFWLKRAVNQSPDETVLPKPEEMSDAAFDAADAYLQTEWERQQGLPDTSQSK